jgi:hypothetical protein
MPFFKDTVGERERGHTTHEALFLWNGSMIQCYNFQRRSIARGYGVHVDLDHESMKRILIRVTII